VLFAGSPARVARVAPGAALLEREPEAAGPGGRTLQAALASRGTTERAGGREMLGRADEIRDAA
jgi:hypothetical protein